MSSRKLNVMNVSVPADAAAGQRVVAVASSGDEVIFTLPKGVAPGTRLQMIPTRQTIGHRGPLPVAPMHPMANGLNVLANSDAMHLRKTHGGRQSGGSGSGPAQRHAADPFYKPPPPSGGGGGSSLVWGRRFVVHAQQTRAAYAAGSYSDASADAPRRMERGGTAAAHRTKETEIRSMPVAFVAGEAHSRFSLCRALCWPNHAFKMSLYDELENEIATMQRANVAGLTMPCFLCNDHKMVVRLADGTTLGSVEQRRGVVCCHRALEVRDGGGEERLLFTLAAPMQPCSPSALPLGCRSYRMRVHDANGDHVGGLTNGYHLETWGGLFGSFSSCCCCCCSCFGWQATPDKFALTYPSEATVEEKLLLLSANFLLDFMLFE